MDSFAVNDTIVLLLTLFALYSPVAALSFYLPLVAPYGGKDQLRLATSLFINVLAISLSAIWIGEWLLEKVLGLTLYASGQVARRERAGARAQMLLGRLAGILLTAIAVTLLIGGSPRMVHSVLEGLS